MTHERHTDVSQELFALITRVHGSDTSSFYRNIWKNEKEFSRLPTISRDDLIRTPLSMRRYKDHKGLVKIVRDTRGPFLTEWSFADIGTERFGSLSKRPMVYMSGPHEAIEKAMWCYEQNMLPLLAEKDPDIAAIAAEKYQVDSLVTDLGALRKLEPYLKRRKEPLDSISVLGTSFPIEELTGYRAFAAQLRLVIELPEAGAFAEAILTEDAPTFTALEGCVIEKKGTILLTKLRDLVTPIIKYDTGISGIDIW